MTVECGLADEIPVLRNESKSRRLEYQIDSNRWCALKRKEPLSEIGPSTFAPELRCRNIQFATQVLSFRPSLSVMFMTEESLSPFYCAPKAFCGRR